jgi:hypothetical protein
MNGKTGEQTGKRIFVFHCQLSIVNYQLNENHPVAPHHPSEGGNMNNPQ